MPLKKACFLHPWMMSRFTVLLCAWLCCPSVFAAGATTPASLPVIGHAPTATDLTITNNTAPGLNPAIDDSLTAQYTLVDVDGDVASVTSSIWVWQADGAAIGGATASTFTPASVQYGQYLSFSVTPATDPALTDPALGVAPIPSPRMTAPVLPPRADLAREYTESRLGNWKDAKAACADLGFRLPTREELEAMFVKFTRARFVGEDSQADIANTYGWRAAAHWNDEKDFDISRVKQRGYTYIHTDGHSAGGDTTAIRSYVCKK